MSIPEQHSGLFYSDFIAHVIKLRGAGSYLEIGVQNGVNLSKISVDSAVGVDPALDISANVSAGKRRTSLFNITSDAFFSNNDMVGGHAPFDVAFLDGMHLFEFLLRDITNTEKYMHKNGLIMVHDCMPLDGEMIERENSYEGRTPGRYAAAWTGDVWKIIPILQEYRPDLRIYLVDCAPTGLLCITNLSPSSIILSDNYLKICDEYYRAPNDRVAIEELYDGNKVITAEDLLREESHSLYCRV